MLNLLVYMILFASIRNAESKSFLLVETDHRKYLVEKKENKGTRIKTANDWKPMHEKGMKITINENNGIDAEICSTEEFRSKGQDGDPCRTHVDCSYQYEKYLCQWKSGAKEGKCKKRSCSSNEDCQSFTDFPSKCYKKACIPKFCYDNKGCPTGYGCHDRVCKQVFGPECELDCDCGSCNNKFCFKRHCYCKDNFRCNSIQEKEEVGVIATENPELIMPEIAQSRDDICTTAETDCIGTGKLCDGQQEGNCICKNNMCKISSGCGMQILGPYIDCSTCNTEDCEDEGVCIIEDGNCVQTNTGNTNTTANIGIINVPTATKPTELIMPEIAQSRDDSCTTTEIDCIGAHKLCDGMHEGTCICKNNKCKISSGCGTQILSSYIDCSTCSTEDCEDEGACIIEDGNCVKTNTGHTNTVTNTGIKNIPATTKPTELITPGIAQSRDERCITVETDCIGTDKLCDGNQEGNCICKNDKCKISSGCGTKILGFYIDCSSCNTEDCEDEGSCIIEDGYCVSINKRDTYTKKNANTENANVPIATEPTGVHVPASIAKTKDDLCTTAETDCIGIGKLCDGQQDGNCICKNNECKISSGCGTQILGFYKDCSSCSTEDCEDEGACIIEDGYCIIETTENGITTHPDEIDISTEETATIQSFINQTTITPTTNIIATKKSESTIIQSPINQTNITPTTNIIVTKMSVKLEEEATISTPIATEMPDISTEETATIQSFINQTTITPTTNIIATKKSDIRTQETATSQSLINQIIIIPTTNITAIKKSDDSCTTAETDCYGSGKMCDGNQDGNCICENNKCKLSSGCGTDTLGYYIDCSSCNAKDCDDEGACINKDGHCVKITKSVIIQSPINETNITSTTNIISTKQSVKLEEEATMPSPIATEMPDTSTEEIATILSLINQTTITPTTNIITTKNSDESCTTAETNCYGSGKMCDGNQDGNCICKNYKCKISSGCGTDILGYYIDCSSCNAKDCDDEGACTIKDGHCVKTTIKLEEEEGVTMPSPIPTEKRESATIQSPINQTNITPTTNIITTKNSVKSEEEATMPSPITTEMSESAIIQSPINQTNISPTTNIINTKKSVKSEEEEATMPSPIPIEISDICTEETVTIQSLINEATIIPSTNIIATKKSDDSCTTAETDCYGSGNLCDGNQDGNCICKNNKCKISSGCGTDTLGYYLDCSSCNAKDCDDEGACTTKDGHCVKTTTSTSTPTATSGPDINREEAVKITSPIDQGIKIPATKSIATKKSAPCMTAPIDCYGKDKLCDGKQVGDCICKNNKCKHSSACGTQKLGYFIYCTTCSIEDCEDERACIVENGNCVPTSVRNALNQYALGKECITTGGKSCVFPFIFEGTKYKGCRDTSMPWCATMVDENGEYIKDKWGYCHPGCKVHGGGIYRPMWTEKPMWVENPKRPHKKAPGKA